MHHDPLRPPDDNDVKRAIFGGWDIEKQKRQRGLLERIASVEFILKASIPILIAKALGVPTDVFGKLFTEHSIAENAQRMVAFLIGIP